MSKDGSLRLQLFRNGRLSEEVLAPSSTTAPANAVTATSFNEPDLGAWCVVECHVNPSTSLAVAWHPERGVLYSSPGYLWAILPRSDAGGLVTVFRPHFNTPPDASDSLLVNEVRLCALPPYGWRVTRADTDRLLLEGMSEKKKRMTAQLTCSGRWRSSAGNRYDVYYVYYTLQMPVAGSNVRGVHRLFFVRDGKVARSVSCTDEITVQDNTLLEQQQDGVLAPWPEANTWTEGL